MSLQQICLIRVGRVVTLALTLLPGLCFVTPASALTAYAPDYDPDKLMLDMATMVHVASPEYTPGGLLDRSPDYDSLTSPVGALSGSPGDASVIVDIGKNVDLPNPTTYYAVTGIIIFEKNNNPCELVLTGRMVDSRYRAEKARILARYKLDKCHNGPLAPLTEWSDAGFDEYREVFLRAVQVCGGHGNPCPHARVKCGDQGLQGPRRPALAGDRGGDADADPRRAPGAQLPGPSFRGHELRLDRLGRVPGRSAHDRAARPLLQQVASSGR